ncbi:MAG: hypothetical protein WCP79_06790 [Bacillota bacterium]
MYPTISGREGAMFVEIRPAANECYAILEKHNLTIEQSKAVCQYLEERIKHTANEKSLSCN